MTTLRTLVTLWLPVPVFAAAGWLLAAGDLAVQDGVADLDPLFGLATMFIIAVAGCGGLGAVVGGIVGSASRPSRSTAVLFNAVWTAGLLLVFTGHLAVATYTEPVYAESSTLGHQVPYQVAAGGLALVPLGLALLDRRRSSTPADGAVSARQDAPSR